MTEINNDLYNLSLGDTAVSNQEPEGLPTTKLENLAAKKQEKVVYLGQKANSSNIIKDVYNSWTPKEFQYVLGYMKDNEQLNEDGISFIGGDTSRIYHGPTSRFYTAGTNRIGQPEDPAFRDRKSGIAGSHFLTSKDRYTIYPKMAPGPEGVNIDDFIFDGNFSEGTARTLEAARRGNATALTQRVSPPFVDDTDEHKRRFGSGRTEILAARADGSGIFGDTSGQPNLTEERKTQLLEEFNTYRDTVFRSVYPEFKGSYSDLISFQETHSNSIEEKGTVDVTENSPTPFENLRLSMLNRESSGNYEAKNRLGYIGGYQFGAQALETLGYLKKGSFSKDKGNSAIYDSNSWTGKNNINSVEDFKANTKVQDLAFEENTDFNLKELQRLGVITENSTTKEIGGYLAASHLIGAGGLKKYGLQGKDANDTTGQTYFDIGNNAISGNVYGVGSSVPTTTRDLSPTNQDKKSITREEAIAIAKNKLSRERAEAGGIDWKIANTGAAFVSGALKYALDTVDTPVEATGKAVGEAFKLAGKEELGKSISTNWDFMSSEEKRKYASDAVGFNDTLSKEHIQKVGEYYNLASENTDILSPSTWLDWDTEQLGNAFAEAFQDTETAAFSLGYMGTSLIGALGKVTTKLFSTGMKKTAKELADVAADKNLSKEAKKLAVKEIRDSMSLSDKTKMFLSNNADILALGAHMNNDQMDEYIKNNGGEEATILRNMVGWAANSVGAKLDVVTMNSILKGNKLTSEAVQKLLTPMDKTKATRFVKGFIGLGTKAISAGVKEAPQEWTQTLIEEVNKKYGTSEELKGIEGLFNSIILSLDEAATGAIMGTAGGAHTSLAFSSVGTVGKGITSLGGKAAKEIRTKKEKKEDTGEETLVEETPTEKATPKVNIADVQSAGALASVFDTAIRGQSEELADALEQGSDIKGATVNLFDKETYKENLAEIKSSIKTLENFEAPSEGAQAIKDRAIRTLNFSRDSILNSAGTAEDLVLGSKLEAEELALDIIDNSLEGEDLVVPKEKESMVKKLLTANGLTDKDYEELKSEAINLRKDFGVVREEATTGPKGYLTYAKRIQRLLDTGNPSTTKLQKEFDNLRTFKASQNHYASRFTEEIAKLQDTVDTYNKALKSGNTEGVTVPKGISFKINERNETSNFVNVEGNKTSGYKIAKSSLTTLDLAKDNIAKIDTILERFKNSREEFLGVDHFTDPDGAKGKVKKAREIDRKFYEEHKVTKAIVDPSNKKWKNYGDNAPGMVNPEEITSEDVVVINLELHDTSIGRRPSKEGQALIRKAKAAGATIVLDREFTGTKNAKAKGTLGKIIKNLKVDGESTPYGSESGTNTAIKFVPAVKAEKAQEERDQVKAEKDSKEENKKADLSIGIEVFVTGTEVDKLSEEDKASYDAAIERFQGSEEKLKNFVNNTLLGTEKKKGVIATTKEAMDAITNNDSLGDKEKVLEKKALLKDIPKAVRTLVKEAKSKEVEEEREVNELIAEWVKVSNDPDTDLEAWLKSKGLSDDINPVTKEILRSSISTNSGSLFPYTQKTKAGGEKSKVATKPSNIKDDVVEAPITSRGEQALNTSNIVKIVKATLLGTVKASNIKLEGNNGKFVDKYIEDAVKSVGAAVAPIQEAKSIKSAMGAFEGLTEDKTTASITPLRLRLMDNPAVGVLMNENGELNENAAIAVYTSLLNFINTNGHMMKDGIKSKKDLAVMLGKREEEISNDVQQSLKDTGALYKSIVKGMGRDALAQLGLGDKKLETVDRQVFNKLVADLGQLAVLTGVEKGMLEINSDMDAYTFAKRVLNKTDSEISPGAKKASVIFIREAGEGKFDGSKKVIEKFESLLPIENSIRKEPSYRKLSKKEIDAQVKSIRRDMLDLGVAEESAESLRRMMETEWVMDMNLATQLVANKGIIRNALGYVEIDSNKYMKLSSTEKDSQESINRDIEKALDEIDKVTKSNDGNVSMWFKYYMSKNGRLMLDSNTLNPQTVKQLHRFLIQPVDHNNEYHITMDKKKDLTFKHEGKDMTSMIHYAVGQAFGFAVDKKNPRAIKDFSSKVIKHLMKNSTDIDKLRKEFMAKGEVNIKVGKNEVLTLEMEHFSHALQALNFIEDVKKGRSGGKFKPVSTYLTAEFDAVTSGFGLKLLQLPIFKSSLLRKYMAKVGIVGEGNVILDSLKEDNLITMNAVLDNPINPKLSILDSYQELASKIKDISYSELDSEVKRPTIDDTQDAEVWEALRTVLPKMEDGNITSALRNLFKYPFMLFNYGSSTKNIKKLIASEVFNDLVSKLSALDLKKAKEANDPYYKVMEQIADSTDLDKLIDKQEELRGGDGTKIMGIDRVRVGNTKLSVKTYIEGFIKASYGSQVESILNEEFEPFIKAQETINEAFKAMFQVFFSAYEAEYAKVKKEHGVVSDAKDREILNNLKTLMPAIAGPLTKMEEEYKNGRIGIYSTENVEISGAFGGIPSAQADLSEATSEKLKGQKTIKVSSFMKQFQEAYSSGNVIPIHYIDGAVMSRTINAANGGITAIHDAIIPSLTDAEDTVKNYNENVFKTNRDYSYVEQIERSLKAIDKSLESLDEIVLSKKIKITENVKGKDQVTTVSVQEYLVKSLNSFESFAAEVKSGRDKLFRSMEGTVFMHMAATPGSTFTVIKEDANIDFQRNPIKNIIEKISEEC